MPDIGTENRHSAQIGRVGEALASALRELIESLPGRPKGQQQLAKTLGVNKVMSCRLVTALGRKDPLATVHLMPGPEPLRRLVRTARRRGVPAEIARNTEKAIRAFEDLIQAEAGDRSGLDAIISASVPDVRARYEMVAKQTIYRGMRQIKGLSADVTFCTVLVHPSDDDATLDQGLLTGYLGVRRVRPGAGLKLGFRSLLTLALTNQAKDAWSLEGKPVQDLRGVVLDEFCSEPPVDLKVHHKGSQAIYMLDWKGAVGLSSARDVVVGELRRRCVRRYRSPADTRAKSSYSDDISVPSRTHIVDILLHEEVYPDWEPKVRVLELGPLGSADANDESRDMDVLDIAESVQSLGQGIDRFRAVEIPRYAELLHYACEKLGWDPRRFRGHRSRIDYPIVGSQLLFAFDVPIAPSASPTDSGEAVSDSGA